MAKKKHLREEEHPLEETTQPQDGQPTPEGAAAPTEGASAGTPEEGTEPQDAVPTPESGAEAPQGAEPASEEGASPEGEDDPQARLSALEQELEAVRAQAQEYLDGWTRERAAFANYKKRMAEQQDRQRQQLVAEVAKGFLEVLDDLELALKNRPQEGEGAAWAEGIELVYRKLRGALEAQGVEQVPAEPGQPFDPQFHEAISHEPVDGHESGHIIEVVRPGYRVGDLVIRPALVRVAQ